MSNIESKVLMIQYITKTLYDIKKKKRKIEESFELLVIIICLNKGTGGGQATRMMHTAGSTVVYFNIR